MRASPTEIDHWREWIGRRQESEQTIAAFHSRALAALLDRDEMPVDGDTLPLPWHWLYFLEEAKRSATGADGHPNRGGFLPPVPLPRRMWAAGRMTVEAPMVIGERARKQSTVASVVSKEGKTGPLVFVTVRHELHQAGRTCLVEEQDIVYRGAATSAALPIPGEPAPPDPAWTREFVADPAMLFRFSALTFNGHRIHYDRDYATRVELYPALVVHGPLLATLLLDLVRQHRPDAVVEQFAFRAIRPAFDGEPLRLCGEPSATGAKLWTVDAQGFVGMHATATFS